jgi:hypothetical protein
LKRLLGTWDRNGSTSGPTAWQICDDDDDNEKSEHLMGLFSRVFITIYGSENVKFKTNYLLILLLIWRYIAVATDSIVK